jgi:hypothetical protein
MLIELWERLRGYDKWIQAKARIRSSKVEKTPHHDRSGREFDTWSSDNALVWTDQSGQTQSAEFAVPDDSPLYQLIGGETVTIRYNPSDPDQYYFPDLLRSRVGSGLRATLVTIVFWGILFLFLGLPALMDHGEQ